MDGIMDGTVLIKITALLKKLNLSFIWLVMQIHSVHPPPFLLGGGGVEPPTKFSKEGVTFFTGVGGMGADFTSKTFNDKKTL